MLAVIIRFFRSFLYIDCPCCRRQQLGLNGQQDGYKCEACGYAD